MLNFELSKKNNESSIIEGKFDISSFLVLDYIDRVGQELLKEVALFIGLKTSEYVRQKRH